MLVKLTVMPVYYKRAKSTSVSNVLPCWMNILNDLFIYVDSIDKTLY